jgi:hypothetical protein
MRVSAEVDDPHDADEVEEAIAAEAVKAFKDEYGANCRPNDIVILESDEDFDDDPSPDCSDETLPATYDVTDEKAHEIDEIE